MITMRMKADKKTAEIMIYEDIGAGWFGGMSAKQFAEELAKLGKVDNIDVRINSYGGDVFDGLAIYSQLVKSKARVVTYIDGIAASIASIIAMAGEEIHIAEAGFIMIHDAWGVAMGNAAQMREQANVLETVTNSLADVYVSRTGNKLEAVRDWMIAETWFNSTDALKNGLATKVTDNMMKAAAKYDPTKHRFRNAPPTLAASPNLEAARKRVALQRATLAATSLKRYG